MDEDGVSRELGIGRLTKLSQPANRYGCRESRKLGFEGSQPGEEVGQEPSPLGVLPTIGHLVGDEVDEQIEQALGIRPVDKRHRLG